MNATALYEVDSTFAAGVGAWDADRRCPIALGDLLEEMGLPAQAACARWAAAEPDRRVRVPATHVGEKTSPCGPYPTTAGYDASRWMLLIADVLVYADYVPRARLIPEVRGKVCAVFASPRDAILWLLDNWNLGP
jgi:hypothetical protein